MSSSVAASKTSTSCATTTPQHVLSSTSTKTGAVESRSFYVIAGRKLSPYDLLSFDLEYGGYCRQKRSQKRYHRPPKHEVKPRTSSKSSKDKWDF